MARYCGAVCRLCRREGVKLFLKSLRCDSPKCALERKEYPDDPDIWVTTSKCLSVMAFKDFFPFEAGPPANPTAGLYDAVSQALLTAAPGWVGTFGPDAEGAIDLALVMAQTCCLLGVVAILER